MSEAPVVSAPKGDVKLPGVGPVSKKWFIIVGGGAVVTIAYVSYKKKSAAAAAPSAAAADTTGTSALSGQPCVDENGNPGVYDDTGTCQVDTSALGGYYAGSGAGGVSGVTTPVAGTGGFTTNGQWSQQVIMDVQSLGTGVDVPTLTAALGAYIAGQPVSAAQQSLIDQAISIDGYPPVAGANGYPPAMLNQPVAPPASTPATAMTGVAKYPAPTGLKVESIGISSALLVWNAETTQTPPPESYTVQVWTSKGASKLAWESTVEPDQVSGLVQATAVGLTTKTAYHVLVWANGGTASPPGASLSFTTH